MGVRGEPGAHRHLHRHRLWTAHYGEGEHIRGPGACRQLSIGADSTQWTDAALGRTLDQSLLLDDFFGTPVLPGPRYVEFDMSKLPVLKHQIAVDEVAGAQTWGVLLTGSPG